MTGGQLDAQRLGRARLEVARLNDAGEPRFEAGRHVRYERFEAHARVRKFGRECRIGRQRRHQHHAGVGNMAEHAGEHAGAQHVAGTASIGYRPQQAG